MTKSEILNVHYNNELAGHLQKIYLPQGVEYHFQYLAEYVKKRGLPISHSLPLRLEPHISLGQVHPFFSNLVSEGVWLRIQSLSQKVDQNDFFELLARNGEETIGLVSIKRGRLS